MARCCRSKNTVRKEKWKSANNPKPSFLFQVQRFLLHAAFTASDGNRLLLREKGVRMSCTISYMVWKLSPLGKLERLRLTRNILGMEQQHYRRAHNQLRTKGDTEQSQDAFVLLQNRTSHRRGPIDCIQSPECNLSSSFSNKPSILDGCY